MYAEVCAQLHRKVPKCTQTHTDEYGHISFYIFSHVCICFSKMCVIKCVCVLLDVTTFVKQSLADVRQLTFSKFKI